MTTNNGHVSSPLAVRGATLKFGGVTALDDVSISVADDELLAIIGPNGAGKTSLLNVTAGFYRPQKGRVELSGQDVTGLRVDQIARRGLARTFQGTHLFAGQTVVENIMIGRHMLMKSNVVQAFFQFGPVMREESEHREAAEEIIDFLEIEAIRNRPVGTLGYGLRKRVDLGRALAQEPSILLMDEPMAGMNQEEKGYMSRFILDARAERGVSVLLIEHHMDVITGICDRMLALNYGEMIASGIPKEVVKDPRVIEAYIGGSHD